jgi:3-methyladenine DNA glycosylase/8-oxoguanine DNA glycosylase
MADRPRAYGRYKATAQNRSVMTCLKPDAWEAVAEVMATQQLSASGAVHHLVRLAAGLPPLNPL